MVAGCRAGRRESGWSEVGWRVVGGQRPARSLSWSATAAPAGLLGDDHDQGVVAGHGAEDLGQAGPVEGGADHVGRAGRGAEHDQVGRVGDLDHPVAEHAAQVVLRGDLLGWAARGWRRRSRRPGPAP